MERNICNGSLQAARRAITLVLTVAILANGLAAGAIAAPGVAPEGIFSGFYEATVPATAAAGATIQVPVSLTNIGNETWNFAGTNPVNLSYHWYKPGLTEIVVWEGLRTKLTADVPSGAKTSVTANVMLPPAGGAYVLRFNLVREGLAWFQQMSDPFAVQATSAYSVQFGAVQSAPFLTGATRTVSVPVTNVGSSPWNAAGPNNITLSYHWQDAAGRVLVWDGTRTLLTADVAPGATVTLQAQVTPPAAGTGYTLTFDLVREGVNWFEFLGGTPLRISTSVEAARFSVGYQVASATNAVIGETKKIAVTVTNTGNVPWSAAGPNPVNLSYHLFDSVGRTIVWDGIRTSIGQDLAPGASRVIELNAVMPTAIGSYTLNVDAVREGVSWFSGLGSIAASTALSVSSGFSAGYAATTTPALATIGASLQLSVTVVNYGPRTLNAGGDNPVSLSYHLQNSNGGVITWEGRRGVLPRDIAPGESVAVPITVLLPSTIGTYRIAWDLVQEGVAWFSQLGVTMKVESVTVQPGVTFYGKGFGHGVGMSQHGAQGLATGAAGPARTGEQIVAFYYSGATAAVSPPPGGGIRVLLSAPSSTGQFNCSGTAYMDTWLANIQNPGGFRVLNEGAGDAEIGRGAAGVSWQIAARANLVEVWNNGVNPPVQVYKGAGPVVVVPLVATEPTTLSEKGVYRGNLRFSNLGNTLRTINFINYDDYIRGVVPLEMPSTWHPEALKAQALAARSYAFTSYKGGSRDYDVSDDQSDQCYGGVRLLNGRATEVASTNIAVDATLGKVIVTGGEVVRAYFSSSSGGYTLAYGCWGSTKTSCSSSPDHLQGIPDPADLAVTVPVPNRHADWSATYTSAQIRSTVLGINGVDIGTLFSVDLSNQSPAGIGHVISVRIVGSGGSVNLPADQFFRGRLGLKSTMVRLSPF